MDDQKKKAIRMITQKFEHLDRLNATQLAALYCTLEAAQEFALCNQVFDAGSANCGQDKFVTIVKQLRQTLYLGQGE